MALKFGTSGIRGLNSEFTPAVVQAYITAFIEYAKTKTTCGQIAVAGDLRESTPGIQQLVGQAIKNCGCYPLDCGRLPTPALALYCMKRQVPGVMITGSHIPADRNGIKFYWPWGEILKEDEMEILRRFDGLYNEGRDSALIESAEASEARTLYVNRYTKFFSPYRESFRGKKVVVYQHSAVARDLWKPILSDLGFEVLEVGRSPIFTPVDTETDEAVKNLRSIFDVSKVGNIFAVVSSDGDADRPFLCDENLDMVRGDSIGILSSAFLKADCVVTPVSTNTALEHSHVAKKVLRTRIGSPFVIEGMLAEAKGGVVVGFEANGGLLLGSEVHLAGHELSSLPTRDSILPVLCCLALACQKSLTLGQLVATLPARYTDAGLLRDFPVEKKNEIYQAIFEDRPFETEFIRPFGKIIERSEIDGLRLTFANGNIIHFRPSGNAPEFRCYAEAESVAMARELVKKGLAWLERWRAGR